MEHLDALVIGAGVVGLAVARELALRGLDVVVAERETAIGAGVSSRNSEVLHAGHYYPTGSAKARWCVAGRRELVAFCQSHGVSYRLCGKLVVATRDAEVPRLQSLLANGQANGVEDLVLLDADQARVMEPALHCEAALYSPATGIVDSHGLMLALLGDAESHGALLALGCPVVTARREAGRWVVRTGGEAAFEVGCRWVVNAAGLGAQAVASSFEGLPASAVPTQHLAKGHYFAWSGKAPFSHLIYPLPVDGGLGIHLTLDLAGQARFGPDVQWLPQGLAESALDYRVDEARKEAFAADIRRYWPGLPAHGLAPAYSGIRPKLSGPGEPAADFVVSGPAQHGLPGLVNLFGIESPGLTACMAIAQAAAKALDLERSA
jgi:L-2-hydroxyglutarate oxidase LhgO